MRKFWSNVGVVSLASALGQLLFVLMAPVFTRLYSAEELALYGSYLVLLGLALTICSLKLETAVPLAAPGEVRSTVGLCIALTICLSIAGFAFVQLFGTELRAFFKIDSADTLVSSVFIALIPAGIFQCLALYAIKQQEYKRLTVSRSTQSVVTAAAQLTAGFGNLGGIGLTIGDMLGRTCSLGVISSYYLPGMKEIHPREVIKLLRKNWRIPVFLLPASFLNQLSTQLPIVFGPRCFGLNEAGAFFLAYRVLFLPAGVLAGAISQVFFGNVVNMNNPADRRALTGRLILLLLACGLPLYGGIALNAHTAFPLFFGAEWKLAGELGAALAIQGVLWIVASGVSTLLLIGERFLESLLLNFAQIVIAVVSLMVGYEYESIILATKLNTTGVFFLQCLTLYRYGLVVGLSFSAIFENAIRLIIPINTCFFVLQAAFQFIDPLLSLLIFMVGCVPIIFWTSRRCLQASP